MGRYEEAYAAAGRGGEHPQELGLSPQSPVQLVEAAARLGKPERAAAAVCHITDTARASGTDWAPGTAAGVRALVSGGKEADTRCRESVGRLDNAGTRMYAARSATSAT
jgi:hypothetical protein